MYFPLHCVSNPIEKIKLISNALLMVQSVSITEKNKLGILNQWVIQSNRSEVIAKCIENNTEITTDCALGVEYDLYLRNVYSPRNQVGTQLVYYDSYTSVGECVNAMKQADLGYLHKVCCANCPKYESFDSNPCDDCPFYKQDTNYPYKVRQELVDYYNKRDGLF